MTSSLPPGRPHCTSKHWGFTVSHIRLPAVPVCGRLDEFYVHLHFSREALPGRGLNASKLPEPCSMQPCPPIGAEHLQVSTHMAKHRTPHSHWYHTLGMRKTRGAPDKTGHKCRLQTQIQWTCSLWTHGRGSSHLDSSNRSPVFQQAFKIVRPLAVAQRWRHI